MKIEAQIVGDSLSPQGNRLTSLMVTFPRFILAELNTHRMLSKNSASSRAIPTHKLLKMLRENPFVPIAWQKEHKGMQGVEYITGEEIESCIEVWLSARDHAINHAENLLFDGNGCTPVTKQLTNRLLEPFMWHTVLISGSEWENFFELRCPQYGDGTGKLFRSKKDNIEQGEWGHEDPEDEEFDDIYWLKINKGQAEIHMMALAEAIWDAMNESTPKQLQAGEWHIPFIDRIDLKSPLFYFDKEIIKVSTAMAARTSYTVVGDEKEVSYETLIGIHDKMAIQVPFHASPFEHCAKAMLDEEYAKYTKGEGFIREERYNAGPMVSDITIMPEETHGWCRNYRGFIQYRHILESEIQSKL